MAVRLKTLEQRQAQNNQDHACTAVPNKREHFIDLHLASPAYFFNRLLRYNFVYIFADAHMKHNFMPFSLSSQGSFDLGLQ